MVVNDNIEVDAFKTFMVAWLGIDDGKARKFAKIDLADWKEAQPE